MIISFELNERIKVLTISRDCFAFLETEIK